MPPKWGRQRSDSEKTVWCIKDKGKGNKKSERHTRRAATVNTTIRRGRAGDLSNHFIKETPGFNGYRSGSGRGRAGLASVSKLKTERGTESKARPGSEIENETGGKMECGVGIRVKSLIGIQKMRELFAPGFIQIGTVIGGHLFERDFIYAYTIAIRPYNFQGGSISWAAAANNRVLLNGRKIKFKIITILKRLILLAVSKLKTERGTESKARPGSEIENETGGKMECGVGIRVKSLIGIQKMRELFAPGFIQIGTVIGSGIRIESGFEIENGTGVENECGIRIRIKSMTGYGIESETRIKIDIDRYTSNQLLTLVKLNQSLRDPQNNLKPLVQDVVSLTSVVTNAVTMSIRDQESSVFHPAAVRTGIASRALGGTKRAI
ncbi:hypothetical protein EVAR_68241_1 [Eumeta japonica]|uniref:Uncharacterized protein n=1 Tax=Eumeta variegata TaxID=151549 RepID=A0A4C1ZPM3_EUMVA|nr:hypothetical protein EVAR_68241_1 [Eumeta japonica]